MKMQPLRRAAAATATVARAAAAAEVRGELLPCRLLLPGDWPLSGDWLGRGSARERGSARGGGGRKSVARHEGEGWARASRHTHVGLGLRCGRHGILTWVLG